MRYLEGDGLREAEKWMHAAGEVARRAMCLRAKCGTVIVKDGEVIGEGYNAPPLDDEANRACNNEYELPQKYKYDRTCCMHAEWRAVLDACRRNSKKLKGSVLYFTRVKDDGTLPKSGEPICTVCSRFALDVGVATFVLWQEDGMNAYPTDEYNRISYGR